MRYLLTRHVIESIKTYYTHVAERYKHTCDYDDFIHNIDNALTAASTIERDKECKNTHSNRTPTLLIWRDFLMAQTPIWYFAYLVKDDVVLVIDACHKNNMSDDAFHLHLQNKAFYETLFNKANPTISPYVNKKAGRDVGCGASIIYNDNGYHNLVRKCDRRESTRLPKFENKYNRIIRDFISRNNKIIPAIGERDNQFYFIDYYSGKETKIEDQRIVNHYKQSYENKKSRKKRLYEAIMKDVAKIIREHLCHWGK